MNSLLQRNPTARGLPKIVVFGLLPTRPQNQLARRRFYDPSIFPGGMNHE